MSDKEVLTDAHEKLQEYYKMLKRIEEVEGFLDNCEWKHFTIQNARNCVQHIKDGTGYI